MTKSGARSRRLLYLSQWFPPEPVAIPLWIAQSLRRRGWDIEVVTAYPNYPEGKVHEGFSSAHYSGDTQDGFPLMRTPVFASHDDSAARRMLNYLSWAVSASIVTPWRSRRDGVTLVYSSPATAALPAMLARLMVRRPYVLVVQDIWPDSVTTAGFIRPSLMLRAVEMALSCFVNASYRLAHAVVVISPGARGLLMRRGVPLSKLHVVPNWADESIMHPVDRPNLLRESLSLPSDAFILMYAGSMGPAQSLDAVVRALALTNPRAYLVLVGDGISRESLEKLAKQAAAGRVHFLDPVPIGDIASLMAEADAQLISLSPDPLFEVTMPSKVQSVLACGSVCIASALGDVARTIEAAGGRAVAPGDEARLASVIDEIAMLPDEELGRLRTRALSYYNEHLSEGASADRLSALLSGILSPAKGRPA